MAKKRASFLGLLIFPVLVLNLTLTGCSDSKLPEVIEAVNDDSSASGGLRKSSFANSFIPSVTETVEEGKSLSLRTVLSSGRKGGLEIPAGSLSVGSEVTLEEAMTIVYDQEVTELLDLKENAKVLTASDAVLLSSSNLEKAKNAMVLVLPVPAFELKVANNPFENLVVIARVFDPSDYGLVKLKVINPDQISLTSNGVEIEIFDFGAYQASIISEKPSEGNKVVVSVSDIENREKRQVIENIMRSEELIAESVCDPSICDPASAPHQTTVGDHNVGDHNVGDHNVGDHNVGDHNVQPSETTSSTIENETAGRKEEKNETKIEISTDVFNNIVKEVIKISKAEDAVSAADDAEDKKKTEEEKQILEKIKEQITEQKGRGKELKLFRVTSLGSSLDMLSLRKFRAFSNPDQQGIVRLMMVLPLDASLYHEILVRKVGGWVPPHRDCTSDGEVVGIWNKADIQDGGALVVDDTIGEHASYRVCVFDEDKNLIHTQSEDSYLSLSFVLQ